jgi:hypothetical protein
VHGCHTAARLRASQELLLARVDMTGGDGRSECIVAPQGFTTLYWRGRTELVPWEQRRLTSCLPLN